MTPGRSERWLKLLLRITGVVMLLAVVAFVMPRSWMVWTHRWLRMGKFPGAPIAEYLARSTSGLYATLGGLMLLTASDVRRYAPVVSFLAGALAAKSLLGLAFGLWMGMPLYWLVGDLVSACGFAVVVLVLQFLVARSCRAGLGDQRS